MHAANKRYQIQQIGDDPSYGNLHAPLWCATMVRSSKNNSSRDCVTVDISVADRYPPRSLHNWPLYSTLADRFRGFQRSYPWIRPNFSAVCSHSSDM
jgi:hypothetical protein